VKLVWAPCAAGAEVALWKLGGAGHGWPGGHIALPERVLGPETHVLSAAEEVFRFVSRFSLESPPPRVQREAGTCR
jgi:poly(3-hydroxybutyrate) depolymerase